MNNDDTALQILNIFCVLQVIFTISPLFSSSGPVLISFVLDNPLQSLP